MSGITSLSSGYPIVATVDFRPRRNKWIMMLTSPSGIALNMLFKMSVSAKNHLQKVGLDVSKLWTTHISPRLSPIVEKIKKIFNFIIKGTVSALNKIKIRLLINKPINNNNLFNNLDRSYQPDNDKRPLRTYDINVSA